MYFSTDANIKAPISRSCSIVDPIAQLTFNVATALKNRAQSGWASCDMNRHCYFA